MLDGKSELLTRLKACLQVVESFDWLMIKPPLGSGFLGSSAVRNMPDGLRQVSNLPVNVISAIAAVRIGGFLGGMGSSG